MPRAPPVTYRSESLEEAHYRMLMVGPAGYADRTSTDDYVDLGELLGEDHDGDA